MTWTEAKFREFNSAFLKRKIVESMEARKLAMISGLYSNTNLDDDKGTRTKIIKELEEQFSEAIAELYEPSEKKPDPLEDNPFFAGLNAEELTESELIALKKPSNQPWIQTDLSKDL